MYITRYPPPANWSRLIEKIEIDLNVFEELLRGIYKPKSENYKNQIIYC